MSLSLKRAYEPADKSDGVRVLVDRLWPRGVKKAEASIDLWRKELAPSTELRKWFGHDPEKWSEFQQRYRAELKDNPGLAEIRALVREGKVTLIYGAKDAEHNQALVLKEVLEHGTCASACRICACSAQLRAVRRPRPEAASAPASAPERGQRAAIRP